MCNPTYLFCAIFHDEVPREGIFTGREFVTFHPVVFGHTALNCDFCHGGLPFKCYLQPFQPPAVYRPSSPESAAVQPRIDSGPAAAPLRAGGQLGVFYFATFHAQRTGASCKREKIKLSLFAIRRLVQWTLIIPSRKDSPLAWALRKAITLWENNYL